MAYENITNGGLWVIRHKPTGKLLPANPKGYGHTQMHVEGNNEKMTLVPRLFDNEKTAKRALIQWLQGVFRNQWEDGIEVNTPKTPRVKDDMEVIEVELIHYIPIPGDKSLHENDQ